jgi:predicted dehydrogenase
MKIRDALLLTAMNKKDRSRRNISRREFVGNSLKVALGATLLPILLPSCTGKKAPGDRIRIAHIGVGSRGMDELIYYLLPLREALNIAVCDVFKDRRENAAAVINKFYKDNNDPVPLCASYLDFDDILQRKDIDAVHITTPDHWHVPAAIKAARAGKHIMLAKPLGLSYPEYFMLAGELKSNNVHFHYGTQQRTSEHMRLGYNMIREGLIGEIGQVDVWAPGKNSVESPVCREAPVPPYFDFDRWTGPAPMRTYCPDRVTNNSSWFNYDYSIGFLAGWGANPLDILVWILKDKVSGVYSCEGTGQFWPAGGLYNNILSWDVKCKYQNGLEVHFVSTDVAEKGMLDRLGKKDGNGTTFYGTKGWISLSRSSAQSDIPEINRKLNNFPKNKEGWINSENNKMGKVFVDIIKGKSEELCPLDEAIISDSISHMGDITIRTNRKVTWDPVKGEVIGDPEANKLFIRQPRSPYTL